MKININNNINKNQIKIKINIKILYGYLFSNDMLSLFFLYIFFMLSSFLRVIPHNRVVEKILPAGAGAENNRNFRGI